MSRKLSWLIFILFALVALILGFKQMTYQTQSTQISPKPLENYSWQMFDSTTWVLNPSAQTLVKADAIYFQEQSQIAEFTNPQILQLTPDKTTRIQSQFATSVGKNEIRFNGQVKMQSSTTNDKAANKTLTTEQITYNNVSQQLSSPVKVTLQAPQVFISGVGFDGNLVQGNYQFHSQVTTFYQPTKE